MINVFEKYEKPYQRIVRRLAIDIWNNRADKSALELFYSRAKRFRNNYEKALVKHYKEKNIHIFPGTIKAKADQWFSDQSVLVETLSSISDIKKNNIKTDLIEDYIKDKSPKTQKLLNDLYLSEAEKAAGGKVLRVYSFKDNLEKKAEQMGSQAAFDFGTEINDAVLGEQFEAYDWNTQGDHKVRKTHRKLNKKTFLFSDPPTTIDKYGRQHTGNCGTDWGCRCFGSPPTGKPLRNYVVRE